MALFGRVFNPKTPPKPEPKIILDETQEQAVKTDAPKVLVLAGAGSGKTRVLTERVKYLLNEKGVEPMSVVAITFTNMAAEEMKTRLSDVKGIGDCFIGTIHSFANHVLAQSGEQYSLFGDSEDLDFHKELIERYCKQLKVKTWLKYREMQMKAERGEITAREASACLSPFEAAELHFIERDTIEFPLDPSVEQEYPETIKSLCKERGVITFDELLVKTTNYFANLDSHPGYVLVDEFQDVGKLESNFLKSLNADSYFYVGDDKQAIYGFKGGNVNLFCALNFSSDWQTYELGYNYRNPTEILDFSERVLTGVKSLPHSSEAVSKETGSIEIYSRNRGKEDLALKLKAIPKNERRETFVLTRTNKELYELLSVLKANNIPVSTFKREGMSLTDLNYLMSLDTIKLLTVHTAKGLEADNVFLWGNFPTSVPSYMLNADERRVMYVGVTRSKKNLTIYT